MRSNFLYLPVLFDNHQPFYAHLFKKKKSCLLSHKNNILAEHFMNTSLGRDSRTTGLFLLSTLKYIQKLKNTPNRSPDRCNDFLTLKSFPQLQGHLYCSKHKNDTSVLEIFPCHGPQNLWICYLK